MTMRQVIILLLMAICACQGFAVTSSGSIFTERVKSTMSLIAVASAVAAIAAAVALKSLVLGITAVVVYFLFAGVGQTVALLMMGRARQITPFSWVLTALSVVIAYCVIFGRVLKM